MPDKSRPTSASSSNSSSQSNSPTTETTPFSAAPWNYLTEVSRWQWAIANDSACAVFRGIEAMRSVQQQMAHQALTQHEAVAQKLHENCAPADLLSIQSNLLRTDVQSALQYWQQLGGAAMKAQMELMEGHKRILAPAATDPFQPILQAWQSAIPHPFNGSGQPLGSH